MKKEFDQIRAELGKYITLQFDYPPTGEGSVGFKGHNMYRFKTEDKDRINEFIAEHIEDYLGEVNIAAMAQEILTDLLDEGLIEYGGYDYKQKTKSNFSI